MTMNKLLIGFEHDKETKNTHRYSEVTRKADSTPVVGKLYIHKTRLPSPPPQHIKITIEEA